jgi:hypothetical protein
LEPLQRRENQYTPQQHRPDRNWQNNNGGGRTMNQPASYNNRNGIGRQASGNGNYGGYSNEYEASYRQNNGYNGGNRTQNNGGGHNSGQGYGQWQNNSNENGYGNGNGSGNLTGGYTERRTDPDPYGQPNYNGNTDRAGGGGGGNSSIGGGGNNTDQQNYTNGEPRNTNGVENWTQRDTDRPTGQAMATSNGTMGRPRLGSKRGRDGGTLDADARQEDGPPRTRQRQLQL